MEGPRQLEQLRWAREAKVEKERARVAEEAEQRRQETRRREQEAINSRRLASLESEWATFKAAANAAVQQQQQTARQRALEKTFEEISLLIRGPKEPEIIVIDGDSGAGPELLFTEPHRWY
jgi:hypothetical protein